MVITIARTSTAGMIRKNPYVDNESTGIPVGTVVESSEEEK